MKEANLRLRLVVRRHNLPEVRVLFSTSLQEGPTIANLLEQVNDTVPLESPDWGLDDYVVEVEDSHGHGFECLHFQPVSTILDRDEEVIIRPLFTVDRKKRLLSGRDQISTDGKHLVDGVPFGRPRLRIPRGRPPIDIPPLKRRRITFDGVEDNDEEESEEDDEYQAGPDYTEDEDEEDAPLLLTENGEDEDELGAVRVTADFDDEDADGDADQEQEDEQELDEEEAEDEDEPEIDEAELLDELRDLQQDNDIIADEEPSLNVEPTPAKPPSPVAPTTDSDLARLNKITALRRAFPVVDCHVYEDVLRSNNLDEGRAYKELQKWYEASMTLDQMRDLLASFSCPVLPSSNSFDAGAKEAESDAESTSSLVKRYDQHGFPSGSILDGSASRIAAEALRKAGHSVRSPVHTKFDGDSAETVEPPPARQVSGKNEKAKNADEIELDEDDEDTDTSESSSSGDSDEDDEDEEADVSDDEDDSDSDSDESSSEEDASGDDDGSDEDSAPEVASTKPPTNASSSPSGGRKSTVSQSGKDSGQSKKRKRGPAGTQEDTELDNTAARDSSSSEDPSDSSSDSESSSSEESSDEQSKRQASPTSTPKPAKVVLPRTKQPTPQPQPVKVPERSAPGHGLSKTRARNIRRKLAKQAQRVAPGKTASPPAAVTSEENPKETLPTWEVEFELRKQALLKKLAEGNTEVASLEPEDVSSGAQIGTAKDGAQATPEPVAVPQVTPSGTETASQRRAKLDVGAGRRMLFASLGLKNPKTKADEDKIRGDLMKGVKPLINHRIAETSAGENGKIAEADEVIEPEQDDTEAWRSRITYRAVECVQEGVELSEPPFPFVQRWDPQQQIAWKDRRGGKGKRKQRNQVDFYEDDSALPSSKKQRYDETEGDSSFAAEGNNTQDQDVELNYDDIPDSVPDTTRADKDFSQLTDVDDLPPLPKDLASLPELRLPEAKPGMVISWKQMLVSKATNWAPQVLDVTAVIVKTDESTQELRVVLARRDRNLDGNEKIYDDDGNRVYDRFDAPDDDEDPDTNDAEGYRTIQYSDMMEPRIVQQPLPSQQDAALPIIVESEDQADMVMADSEGPASDGVEKEVPSPDDVQDDSTTLSNQQEPEKEHAEIPAGVASADQQDQPHEESYGSVIPDSVPQGRTEGLLSIQSELTSKPVEDVSITEDSRHDISAMIHEAGFRTDVSPSVAKDARFSIEDLSSPSRQLDEESAAAVSQKGSKSPAPAESGRSASPPHETTMPASMDGAADEPPATVDEPLAVADEPPAAEEEPPAAADEQDTPYANTARDATPVVAYPQLPVPSSASSVRSGRQPDDDFSMDWEEDDLIHRSEDLGEDILTMEDSRIETNMDESTPTKPKGPPTEGSDRSLESSPLPSLEELFGTASQSRPTQSPVKAKMSAAIKARKPEAKRDLEYEEIMRRVDNSDLGWEDDQGQIKNPPSSITWDEQRGQIKEERWSQAKLNPALKALSLRKSSTRPSQSQPKLAKPEPSSLRSISPPMPKRRRTTKKAEKFTIPEGSQVVSFLTSSEAEEPDVEEHYAEDSIDSTYEEQDSDLPEGSGWVKKGPASTGKGERGRRGVSLSALPGDGKRVIGGGKMPSSSLGGDLKAARGRRKTSAKF